MPSLLMTKSVTSGPTCGVGGGGGGGGEGGGVLHQKNKLCENNWNIESCN